MGQGARLRAKGIAVSNVNFAPRNLTQAINPWSWFQSALQAIGFVNIYQLNTPAPETERRIIEEVGSYGRQLGWLAEGLQVLIDRAVLKPDKLSRAEECALHQVTSMLQKVQEMKGGPASATSSPIGDELTWPEVERFAEKLGILKERNESMYGRVVETLRGALDA